MLFLYRPRQTWMPYRIPRQPSQQGAYNRQMQETFAATRQVPRYAPESPLPPAPAPPAPPPAAASSRDSIADLKGLAELHASGVLNDEEFAAAKAKILGIGR
jgi:hypothetical protein